MAGTEVRSWAMPPTGIRLLTLNLGVLVLYGVVGALTLSIGQYAGLASPLWPAAGIGFAVVYAWGWRLAPAVLLGSIAANGFSLAREGVLTREAMVVTLAIGIGAALQAMVGSALVTRVVGRRPSLTGAFQIVAFLLLAGPVAATINATLSSIAQFSLGLVSFDQALLVWVTWWAGDSIGVVVFAPLALMVIPGQGPTWNGRRIRVAIPVLIGVGLYAGLFVQADMTARTERELALGRLATSAAGELQRNIARHQESLEGLASFFESSEQVNAEEFQSYTKGALERFDNLQALSWNPLVTPEELAEFEASQRTDQGLDDYTVTERDESGNLVPVTERDEYVPVGFIEPLLENLAALGFDISSNPVRKEAIDRSRELGVPIATAPIDLVQESGTQKGILALAPVFKRSASDPGSTRDLKGFAVGVYRLGDLLTDTFNNPAWDDVEITLEDVTVSEEPEPVAVRPAINSATIDETSRVEAAVASDSFEFYGRDWQIDVRPTSGEFAATYRPIPPIIDVIGLVILTLLQSFVLLVTGLERLAKQRAEDAGREANTDELTGLQNRRAFLRTLNAVRERSKSDGSSHVLMYIDLDNFKAVNDRGGHEAGDRLLQEVGQTFSENVRNRDAVARLGGDEFAIILVNCGLDKGLEIAQSFVPEINALAVDTDAGPLSVGVSIGVVSILPNDGQSVDELIRRADDASYEAKRDGGGVRRAQTPTPT